MKPPRCDTRIEIPKILKALMGLACIKFAILVGWGLIPDLQSPHSPSAGNPGMSVLDAATPAFAAEAQSQQVAQETAPTYSEKWERLTRKEEELNRREQELDQLEQSIDAKLARLEELEARLQKMLEQADVLKDEKLKHLVDVYSNMKAKQAAEVLETLDQDIAVKILAGMRGRTAGSILSFVEAKKAARLSEALTEMQMPFEQ